MQPENPQLTNALARLGRDPGISGKAVNLPLYQCSTMLFDSVADFEKSKTDRYDKGTLYYGRYGNPASFELESMMARLEGGDGCISLSSGLTAVTIALMAFGQAESHVLVADTVYGPTRLFCDNVLARYGVDVEYVDSMDLDAVAASFRANTSALFLEAPGSGTFEVPDLPALALAARNAGIVSILDGTWATPVFCKPMELGIDIVVHSGSKYICGHSDAMIGFIVSREKHYEPLRRMALAFGDRAGATDIFLALRGLRTLEMRMQHHQANGLKVASWLKQQPEVKRVLHPAFADCLGHEHWERDFSGAGGLFSVVLNPVTRQSLHAMVDNLEMFGIGLSWGGFESLALPVDPKPMRTARPWTEDGNVIRFSIGIENTDDLIADLAQGLKRLESLS